LLKFNMFWIVLMCWCQKWFLKNEKTSLVCILTRKVIWKTPATTLPNTLYPFSSLNSTIALLKIFEWQTSSS
jgi:hypothetical protein